MLVVVTRVWRSSFSAFATGRAKWTGKGAPLLASFGLLYREDFGVRNGNVLLDCALLIVEFVYTYIFSQPRISIADTHCCSLSMRVRRFIRFTSDSRELGLRPGTMKKNKNKKAKKKKEKTNEKAVSWSSRDHPPRATLLHSANPLNRLVRIAAAYQNPESMELRERALDTHARESTYSKFETTTPKSF